MPLDNLHTHRPASESPPKPGIYATNRGGYRRWTGEFWVWGGSTVVSARNACADSTYSVPQAYVVPWRPLTTDDPQ